MYDPSQGIRTGQVVQIYSPQTQTWFPAVVQQTRFNKTLDAVAVGGTYAANIPYWHGTIPRGARDEYPVWRFPEEQETSNPMANKTPQDDGYQFGSALSSVFGNPKTTANGAIFALARRFAAMAGYQSAEAAMDYIEGFVTSLKERQMQDTPVLPPASEG